MPVPRNICPGNGLTDVPYKPLRSPTEPPRARTAAMKETGMPLFGASGMEFTFCVPDGCCQE